jgi:phosphohistidine phosphatase
MQLLVIRHAIAEDRDAFAVSGEDDSRRPLTTRGEEKMKEVAAGIRSLVESIDVLGSSPYVRAQQTARIVGDAYGDLPVKTVNALSPECNPSDVVHWLREQRSAHVVAIVGHEPDLGVLATWLMTRLRESRLELKKGGACLLEFSAAPAAGGATLLWALSPAQLRRMS